jgi:hypothetical protein
MACCRRPLDDVQILDSLRIRFPTLSEPKELLTLVRYTVAKEELRRLPNIGKHDEAVVLIKLLLKEVGTPELNELLEKLGGDAFLTEAIRMICHASGGKNRSTGI